MIDIKFGVDILSNPSIYVETTGCALNRALGEYLLGALMEAGYQIVDNPEEADIIIFNGCIIKKPTEDRARSRLKQLKKLAEKKGAKIIVAGCIAQVAKNRFENIGDFSFVGVYNLLRLPDLIPRILSGERIIDLTVRSFSPFGIPRVLSNRYIATVPISRGCLGKCTFCVDRLIWGKLRSYSPDQIVSEIKKLLKRGVKEIRLSGQDTGPYGWDIGLTLADLLEKISAIEGDFMIRIGMASPDTFIKVANDVLNIMKHDERFYRYLHLPVQSGSDRILKLMGRNYTSEEYINLINLIRKRIDDITIATDIIVAFPTETEEDHELTLKLLKQVKPDIVNISRYGDRPGVPSAKLRPKVNSKVAKRRTIEVAKLVMEISYSRNSRYLNSNQDVLLLEKDSSSHEHRLLGRTRNYRNVAVALPSEYLGHWVQVLIKEVTWKTLYGEPLSKLR